MILEWLVICGSLYEAWRYAPIDSAMVLTVAALCALIFRLLREYREEDL